MMVMRNARYQIMQLSPVGYHHPFLYSSFVSLPLSHPTSTSHSDPSTMMKKQAQLRHPSYGRYGMVAPAHLLRITRFFFPLFLFSSSEELGT